MKKIILLVGALALSMVSMAQQTDRSKVLAGGILNFNWGDAKETINSSTGGGSTKTAAPTNLDFTFSPNVGIFLFNNFAMGLKLRSEIKNSYQGGNSSFNSNFSVGPFVRYYKKVSKFAAFGQLSYGIGNISASGDYVQSSSIKGSVIGIGPGVALFLTEKIGIEALLNYEYLSSTTDINAGGISTKVSRGNSMRLEVGLQVYL